ncbi:4-hydroxybenzoate polyprenyltransferase [Geobacter sp. DSM 9736]|nr:4-hydroxybenzoate polyprenyltransferase [Geobacter sp. DSM 9736]
MYGYLQLCRVSNLPTVWVNVLAACLLSGGDLSWLKVSLLLTGISMAYCGGMAMNDCVDSAADTLHRPERPIPSGRITVTQGTVLYVILFFFAVVTFAAAGGIPAFAAGIFLLILIVLYNLVHNLSPLSVIPMAGCRFMIYVVSGLACSGTLSFPLLALATVQFGYILLLSLAARLEKGGKVKRRGMPLVPVMLAGIPVVDGIALAFVVGPGWFTAGIAGGAATLAFQRKVRGD